MKGYTLVEAIIYVAILAILAVTFISLLFTMVQAYTEFRLARDLVSSAALGLERVGRETRQAASVDPASTLGSHPGRLLLNTTNESGAPKTVDFYLSAGALMIKDGAALAASTTSGLVTVDNLVFRQINTAESQAVKVELTLSASRGSLTRTEKFYDTAVLRGSY
ncbi:MAG: prepilin-type N-terminal cleavage/methylation domain-containing protein [Candidatus Vogelbacteria bacterium]|nr:prepilin-type N-terminal cleavage/methylation domain-containing protein [Candidatus Vogelbacteria bacterium]